jgi:hypothetical protein
MKTCSPISLHKFPFGISLVISLVTSIGLASQAQAQVPLPGSYGDNMQSSQPQTQPVQQAPKPTAPIPGNMPNPTNSAMSAYQLLPLNAVDAQARIENLKQTISTARPTKDLQESVYQLCEWLTDMANAHYKLAGVFSKHETSKAQAELERRQALKFSQLKNQAQLLKAELLIRQNRYPEALSPLVDIVSNEPKSVTGQQAYKRLQQIGFSEEVQEEPKVTAAETAPTQAVSESKGSATISRAGTVSVEGYVGTPNTSSQKPKTSVVSQPTKAPMPAPNQVLNVR